MVRLAHHEIRARLVADHFQRIGRAVRDVDLEALAGDERLMAVDADADLAFHTIMPMRLSGHMVVGVLVPAASWI